jgi:hypothetical protein
VDREAGHDISFFFLAEMEGYDMMKLLAVRAFRGGGGRGTRWPASIGVDYGPISETLSQMDDAAPD